MESNILETPLIETSSVDDTPTIVETHTIVDEPPTNVDEPPTNVDEPPTNVDEPPTNVDEPPTNVDEPPTNVDEPPTNVDEPPTNVDEPPTNVDEPPVETHIDPAISESFIKELFIEMVDIKGQDIEAPVIEKPNPVVENQNLVVETPFIENTVLDEIDISSENTLQIVIQIPSEDTNVIENTNTIGTKTGIDQDTLQRISVGVQVCLELYRVITSSLLILFVPQICEDHICTTTENLVWETNTYNTALCFNFISMACLVNMYYMELVRENRMIKYLAVNPELANDNDGVGKQLELLSMNKQNKIFTINKYYRISSYGAAAIYLLNVLLSAAAVNKYYAGSQTVSTFVTYVLFMATKFASVHSLVSTDKNIFYSAYIVGKVQYNDIDPDCKNK
jgi:hypothetical protein